MFLDKIFSIVPKYYEEGWIKFDVLKLFGKNFLYIYRGFKIYDVYADKFNEYFKANDMELKIKNLKRNMDKISCDYIDFYMGLSKYWGKYLTKNYWSKYDKELLQKYEKMDFSQPFPEIATFRGITFHNKYGLNDLPQEVLKSINGKDIIDAGGYNGDTAFIFKDLFPESNIYVYEPLSVYLDILKKVAERINSVGGGAVIPVHKGLGAKQERIDLSFNSPVENCEITTFDADYKGNNLGLIKMDTEGFESQILAGCAQMIRKYKPVLVIAIYHTPEDFFDMKAKLAELNPDYRFMIRRSEFICPNLDYVLIAY